MFAGWIRDQLSASGLSELASDEIAARLTDAEVDELLELYEAELWQQRHRKFANLFPEAFTKIGDGDWSEYWPRAAYPQHMEFFRVGKRYDERCFMAGNRVGKTVVGGFELTAHLTGLYPEWWEGRRFRHPIRAIAAGKTNETTRDIVQAILLGEIKWEGNRKTVDGTGIIPTELIGRANGQLSWKQGSPDLVDLVKIRHRSGGWSKLSLKSYQQGRGSFEGTSQHAIWVDEEPPLDVYDEARIRTMTTNGICMLTYTPLDGLTDTVLSFLPEAMRPATDEVLNQNDWGNWN